MDNLPKQLCEWLSKWRCEHLKVAKGYNGQGIMNGHDCPYPEGIYDILL